MKCLNLLGDSTASINVDVIGVGTSVYDFFEAYIGSQVFPVNSASKADEQDRTGNLGFANMRAQLWWKFREMLAPESPYEVALPPDARLLSDLAPPLYRLGARSILIESKQEISKRLGRSTDCGDAVVYAAIRNPVMRSSIRVHSTLSGPQYQSFN